MQVKNVNLSDLENMGCTLVSLPSGRYLFGVQVYAVESVDGNAVSYIEEPFNMESAFVVSQEFRQYVLTKENFKFLKFFYASYFGEKPPFPSHDSSARVEFFVDNHSPYLDNRCEVVSTAMNLFFYWVVKDNMQSSLYAIYPDGEKVLLVSYDEIGD